MPHHPHHETGISDEAAIEAHDIIDRAEEEEHQLHPEGGMGATEGTSTQAKMGDLGKTQPAGGSLPHQEPHKKSGFEKVKEKLHMK